MPRRFNILSLLLAVALVSLALVSLALRTTRAEHRPSRIIYPPQEIPLQFSHALHMGQAEISCVTCHTGVRQSASSLDNNLPQEADCIACHQIDRLESKRNPSSTPCVRCHLSSGGESKAIARVRLPIPNLKFSHEAHLDRGTPCARCHGSLSQVELATAAHLPTMQSCQGCHDGKQAGDRCTTCHLAQAGDRMQTTFPGLGVLSPSGNLRGAAHDMEFRTNHKYVAQNDADFCASCHKKDFCAACHAGVKKPMDIHVGDYVRMHAVEARRNAPDCSSCHRIQTFCQGCHSRMGVADDDKGGQFRGTGGFHPEGWNLMGLAGRGPNHHAFEAQRNIKQCASCHRESDCTTCHSAEASAPRANPHPRNWRGSRKCRALVKRNRRMCRRCHVEQDVGC